MCWCGVLYLIVSCNLASHHHRGSSQELRVVLARRVQAREEEHEAEFACSSKLA